MIALRALKDLINLDIQGILRLLNNIFTEWILSQKPRVVKDKGISERGLRNFKQKVKNGKGMKNESKIARILFEYYKSKLSEQ